MNMEVQNRVGTAITPPVQPLLHLRLAPLALDAHSTHEKTVFAHKIAPGHTGQITISGPCNAECEGALIVRYYIDGEKNASIVY